MDTAITSAESMALPSQVLNDETNTEPFKKPPNEPSRTMEKILAALKFTGAGAVAAAMALFLFEGISVNNDIQRFMTILSFGALLTAAGLSVNKWLSDSVASRLFIGLSLISVPVITSVLGGLIYSLTPAAQAVNYPTFATWTLASGASLWVALPLGLVVISAITALGIMVMARSEVRWMTPALLFSTTLLLIPTRESAIIALIASLSIGALVLAIRKFQVNPISFQTAEGRWALGVLFLAPAILIGRTIALYEPDFFMAVCISGMLYAIARKLFHTSQNNSKTEILFLTAAVSTGFTAITSVTGFAMEIINTNITPIMTNSSGGTSIDPSYAMLIQLLLGLWCALLSIVMFELTNKREDWFAARFISAGTCVVIGLAVLGQSIVQNPHWIVTGVGALILVVSLLDRFARGCLIEAGLLLAALSALFILNIGWFIQTLTGTGWWGLAIVGITAIIGGAILERSWSQKRPVAT